MKPDFDCYGIIPARYASTRFPGKPLTNILGKPMFFHVYQRAMEAGCFKAVVLATDDRRIFDAAEKLNVPGTYDQRGSPQRFGPGS